MRWRTLPDGALRLVLTPVAWVLTSTPRRQLNLPRWVRSREFANLHDVTVAWLDSHFEVIEGGAPWLHRAGAGVWDFCKGGVSPFFRLEPGFSATARCIREVTAAYGFDGPLTARLGPLGEALSAAGWEKHSRPAWTDLDGAPIGLEWRPCAALRYPPGMEGTPPWRSPPLSPNMLMSWSSRGQATWWRPDPNKTLGVTRNYLPLEVSEADVRELVERVLDAHEHVLTVTINLAYYSNPDAKARPHRIPRYLFPTPGH